jgi:hypothetical protein
MSTENSLNCYFDPSSISALNPWVCSPSIPITIVASPSSLTDNSNKQKYAKNLELTAQKERKREAV